MLNVVAPGAVSSAANPILDVWTQKTVTEGDGFVFYGLAAPFSLSFQIWDIRDPDAPVQRYPASPGKQSINLTTDRIGGVDGHYAVPWTVSFGSGAKGRHQLRWFVVDESGGIERAFMRDFDIIPAASTVNGAGTAYAMVSDLRDEGVSASDASDARILKLLGMSARYIERITGRSFRPIEKAAVFDGSGGRAVLFGEPLIALSSLSLGQPPVTDIERETFRIYNRHIVANMIDPDDREDPKIEFAHFSDILGSRRGAMVSSPLFGVPWRDHYFPRSVQNVTVRGLWGYTEFDGTATGGTPELIAQAQRLLVVRDLGGMGGCGSSDRDDARDRHRVISETTRDQSYTKKAEIETPFTGVREIDDVLLLFRRPLHLGSA